MKDIKLINFIDLSQEEKMMILEWRNKIDIQKWMHTQNDISLEEHLDFINSLKTIPNMKDTFGVEVGFSDHTMGHIAPVVAVTLGAKVIEKHFILDKKIGGADSAFSLDKKEFEEMIKAVRDSEKLIGRVDYSLNEKREKQRRFARSLYVSKDIKEGEVFSEDNIKSVRPFYGLHPKYLKDVLGKKAKKDYKFADRLENNTI